MPKKDRNHALSSPKGPLPTDATPYLSSNNSSQLSLPALITNNKTKRSPSLISTHIPTPVISLGATSGPSQRNDCITRLHASALASSSIPLSPPNSALSSSPTSPATFHSRAGPSKPTTIPISTGAPKCGNPTDHVTSSSPLTDTSVLIASPIITIPEATNSLIQYNSFSPQVAPLPLDPTEDIPNQPTNQILDEITHKADNILSESTPSLSLNNKWSYWKRTASLMSLNTSEARDIPSKRVEENAKSILSNEPLNKVPSLKDSVLEPKIEDLSPISDVLETFPEYSSSTTQTKSWVSWIPYIGTQAKISIPDATPDAVPVPVPVHLTEAIPDNSTEIGFFDQNINITSTEGITTTEVETQTTIATTQNENSTVLTVNNKPSISSNNTWFWSRIMPGSGTNNEINVTENSQLIESLDISTREPIIENNESETILNNASESGNLLSSDFSNTNEIIKPTEETSEIYKPTKSWRSWLLNNKETSTSTPKNEDPDQDSDLSYTEDPELPTDVAVLPELQSDSKAKSKTEKNDDKNLIKRPNLVLPAQELCFPTHGKGETLKHTVKYIKDLCLGPSNKSEMMNTKTHHPHLFRTNKPAIIKKAVVIGIHGFFPAKLVRSVLGEPTGTSTKFANEATNALKIWAAKNGITDLEIENIPLEGEGKVFERTENLYEMLFEWIEQIHECDFLFFAAHSQGAPVAVHILAKLIEDGHIFGHKKIGILGMAGISLGPFYGLDQKLLMRAYSSMESASLKELFQFQNQTSFQSRKYTQDLEKVIAHNTKITFIGSINDQLVPLYSSTCIHITHPNVYRAVYIDGTDVTPGFISDLVSLALHIRNIGASDHDLIRELSGALAGALTSGGHSKIYNEPNVYDLAIRNVLETTNCEHDLPLIVEDNFQVPNTNHNPFHLPWAMRSMLYEVTSRPILEHHLEIIRNKFVEWEPETKALKDLKYRLSSINTRM